MKSILLDRTCSFLDGRIHNSVYIVSNHYNSMSVLLSLARIQEFADDQRIQLLNTYGPVFEYNRAKEHEFIETQK